MQNSEMKRSNHLKVNSLLFRPDLIF